MRPQKPWKPTRAQYWLAFIAVLAMAFGDYGVEVAFGVGVLVTVLVDLWIWRKR